MATRTISTRLAIEGEGTYRAALTSTRNELKTLMSQLDLTKSKFKDNATSTEALTAVNQDLTAILHKQEDAVEKCEDGLKNAKLAVENHKKANQDLNAELAKNKEALEKLKSESGDTSEEEKRLKKEIQALTKEIKENEAKIAGAEAGVEKWQQDLNRANKAVIDTNAEIKKNSDLIKENESANNANADAVNALAAAMVASGLKAAIKEIAEALTECVDASVEFESAMAGVKKTTNMSDAELGRMSEEIKQLSTEIPVTTTELAGVVEVAGQLGISKDHLLSFSKVMANLGVSTNMTSEEAATMLARFANVTKMSPELYENLGSVVVALGNNFATTESEIVEMGQRLAAAGKLAGLTEPEIMAIATAMSSVGIQAEAGGTAMTQTLTEMESAVAAGGDKLEKFAEISGMSSEQFVEAWKNEPIVAIQAFIEGLGKLDEQGESATLVLEEMGLSGVRQSNMLKSLATASGLLGNAVGLANTAWAENTALMTEANTRYQTTESKITMFKNSVNNLKIAVGDQLTPALGDLASKGTDVVEWATDFTNKNEWLAPTISAVAASMSVLLGFVTTATVVVPLLTKLVEALNASFLKSPTALVAMGIAAVTAAVVTLVATLPDASEEVKDLRDAMDKLADTMDDAEKTHASTTQEIKSTSKVLDAYITRLEQLEKQSSLTDEEQKEYNRLLGEVKRIMPDANTAIDENTKKLKDGADALRKNVEEWKNMALAAADNARVEAMTQGLTEAYVAMTTAQDNLTVATHNANDQVLNYAAALQELYAAQADYNAILGDSSATVADIEAATNRMADANIKASDAKRGLSKEEREQAEEIAALKSELESATQAAADYEKRIEVLNGPLKEMGEASQKTADGIERSNEAVAAAGETSGEAITEGFSNSLQMGEEARAEMDEVKETVTTAGEEISASAEEAGTQTASSFQEGLSAAPDAATQVMSDVNQAVRLSATEARSAGYSVGAAISQGAAAGVRDYAAQVAAEAAQMVRDAIDAANRAAQINSPSKLTRKTGHGLDEGVIYGIRDLEDDVIATMEDTMRKVAGVQVNIPEIPDHTPAILNAITGGMGSEDKILEALRELGKRRRETPPIDVTQNIYAKDTSYRGQQREAKRQMRALARELSR